MEQRLAERYDLIATEYYSKRHVTSRNFDEATAQFLRDRDLSFASSGLVLDLGAGRGSAGRFLAADPSKVVQLDRSKSMLTLPTREASVGRLVADARDLPFADRCFQGVCAFLFDPYFETELFREVARVLASGGTFLGTLPSKAWGEAVRRLRGYPDDVARFVRIDGAHVDCRSALASPKDLSRQLAQAGFVDIKIESAFLPANVKPVSPDVADVAAEAGVRTEDLPILSVIVART